MVREMDKLVIYTDGGARGNPGPAAIGVVIRDKQYAQTIGSATNNVAEYKAVIFALKKAKQILGAAKAKKTQVAVMSDSELLVEQLSGRFKIKNGELKILFVDVWNLKQDFLAVDFRHINRERNREADH